MPIRDIQDVLTPNQPVNKGALNQSSESSSDDSEDDDSDEESAESAKDEDEKPFIHATPVINIQDEYYKPPAKDRILTSYQKTRGDAKTATNIEHNNVDYYSMIINNKYLQNQLDSEAKGFSIHLSNSNNMDLMNICIQFLRNKKLEEFWDSVEDLCNKFAEDFYEREFSKEEISVLQIKSSNDELQDIFENFSKAGNTVKPFVQSPSWNLKNLGRRRNSMKI